LPKKRKSAAGHDQPLQPASKPPVREAIFHLGFREDLRWWVETDRRIAMRVLELVEAVLRDPFVGIGKPEPLKYIGANVWSRRITQEHRLVYQVSEARIDFLQARYHY
jgi:toxin YoeB